MPPPYGFLNSNWSRAGLKYGRRVYTNQIDAKGDFWEAAADWILANKESVIPKVIENWEIEIGTATAVNAGVNGMMIQVRTMYPAIVFQGWSAAGTENGYRVYTSRLGDIDPAHFTTDQSIYDYAKSICPAVIDRWQINKASMYGKNEGIGEKWVRVLTVGRAADATTRGPWRPIDTESTRAWEADISNIDPTDTINNIWMNYVLNMHIADYINDVPINREKSRITPDGKKIIAISDEISNRISLQMPWETKGIVGHREEFSSRIMGMNSSDNENDVVAQMKRKVPDEIEANANKHDGFWPIDKSQTTSVRASNGGLYLITKSFLMWEPQMLHKYSFESNWTEVGARNGIRYYSSRIIGIPGIIGTLPMVGTPGGPDITDWEKIGEAMKVKLPNTLQAPDGKIYTIDKGDVTVRVSGLSGVWLEVGTGEVKTTLEGVSMQNPWEVKGGGILSSRINGIPPNTPWGPVAENMLATLPDVVLANNGKYYKIMKGSGKVIDTGIGGIYIEIESIPTTGPTDSVPPPSTPSTPTPTDKPTTDKQPKNYGTPDRSVWKGGECDYTEYSSKIPLTFFKMNLGVIIILLCFDKNDEEDLTYIKYSLGTLAAYGLYSVL